MINAIFVTKSIDFTKKLLDEFTLFDLSIRLLGITSNEEETIKLLNLLDIQIIFLDHDILSNYDKRLIRKYREHIILATYKPNSKLIGPKNLKLIKALIEYNDLEVKRREIKNELEYIGYKFKYKGTHYLLDTILQMYKRQDSMVDNLQSNIYPIIAEKYNKTIINIKSSINKATECMYYECDAKRLGNYFQFAYDTKPTVKQVVFAVIGKLGKSA